MQTNNIVINLLLSIMTAAFVLVCVAFIWLLMDISVLELPETDRLLIFLMLDVAIFGSFICALYCVHRMK